MNDQTAQMGFQMGQSALKVGQDYVDQNVFLCLTPHIVQAYNTDSVQPAKSLHPPPSFETLLQRLHLLRPAQTPPGPFPVAA